MISVTTITQKGQVTIPMVMRKALGWSVYDRVQVRMRDGGAIIEPVPDLMNMAGSIRPVKGKSALKARAWMEKNYKRA
jgi:AbrB family looped-hinge helix DNA binding protein